MQITLHDVEGQMLRVGIRRGEKTRRSKAKDKSAAEKAPADDSQ